MNWDGSGNAMIDCDFGDDPRSPNFNHNEWCMYCGCRIDRMNFSDYDGVCEDCIEEHVLNLDEDE